MSSDKEIKVDLNPNQRDILERISKNDIAGLKAELIVSSSEREKKIIFKFFFFCIF